MRLQPGLWGDGTDLVQDRIDTASVPHRDGFATHMGQRFIEITMFLHGSIIHETRRTAGLLSTNFSGDIYVFLSISSQCLSISGEPRIFAIRPIETK
jgi:hypothetical protein